MKLAMPAIERHSCRVSLPRSRAGMLRTAAIPGADKAGLPQYQNFGALVPDATLSHVLLDAIVSQVLRGPRISRRIKRCSPE
jgi:hypothetical protein